LLAENDWQKKKRKKEKEQKASESLLAENDFFSEILFQKF
jgi:hypothetical protein